MPTPACRRRSGESSEDSGIEPQFQYDPAGNLSTVINANNATAATYTYDSFARVRTYSDSEGWTATYDYDAADRVTKVTYPDGTTETYTYDRLDLAAYTDRQYRTWNYVYDGNRRLASVTDPQGQQTLYGYNKRGQVTSLTDPKTNVTSWTYDVQGRLTGKQYPRHRHLRLRDHDQPSQIRHRRGKPGQDLQLRQGRPASGHRLHRRRQPHAQRRLHLGPVLPAPGLAHRRRRHHAVHLRAGGLAGRPAGAAGSGSLRQQRHRLGL
jgi:YD repeat-containing protein